MNDNLTKLNFRFERSKVLRTKLNWKLMKLNEEVTKMGGKTYTTFILYHLSLCFFYFIEMKYDVVLDCDRVTMSRAMFDLEGDDDSTFTRTISLKRDETSCASHTAYIKVYRYIVYIHISQLQNEM